MSLKKGEGPGQAVIPEIVPVQDAEARGAFAMPAKPAIPGWLILAGLFVAVLLFDEIGISVDKED